MYNFYDNLKCITQIPQKQQIIPLNKSEVKNESSTEAVMNLNQMN